VEEQAWKLSFINYHSNIEKASCYTPTIFCFKTKKYKLIDVLVRGFKSPPPHHRSKMAKGSRNYC